MEMKNKHTWCVVVGGMGDIQITADEKDFDGQCLTFRIEVKSSHSL